jgi:dihydroorotase
VTSVLVMPTDKPLTATPGEFSDKRAIAEGGCFVDFGLHAAVSHDVSHIRRLADLGATSFEIFFADANLELRVEFAPELLAALRAIRDIGWTAGITPGDRSIVEAGIRALQTSGTRNLRDYARAYPPVAEAMGLARAAAAALDAGTTIVFRQMSCTSSVDLLRAMKRIGNGLHGEVNPHYLLLTSEKVDEFGPFAMMTPPLRFDSDASALWAGLRDGTIDLISTDHAPHLPSEKEQGRTSFWDVPMGIPGLQTLLPLMLQAVKDGYCAYPDITNWCAKAPARLFGLSPAKGCIAPGADADLVVVDPSRTEPIQDRHQYSRAARTPFAGRPSGGSIDLVFLRGEIICRDGVIADLPAASFCAVARANGLSLVESTIHSALLFEHYPENQFPLLGIMLSGTRAFHLENRSHRSRRESEREVRAHKCCEVISE